MHPFKHVKSAIVRASLPPKKQKKGIYLFLLFIYAKTPKSTNTVTNTTADAMMTTVSGEAPAVVDLLLLVGTNKPWIPAVVSPLTDEAGITLVLYSFKYARCAAS